MKTQISTADCIAIYRNYTQLCHLGCVVCRKRCIIQVHVAEFQLTLIEQRKKYPILSPIGDNRKFSPNLSKIG
jgi:hypothetical protein